MASTAPAQTQQSNGQQNGNRGNQGGDNQQQYHNNKQNGRNPPHKKNYQMKSREDGGSYQGNPQEQRERRPRHDNHEANGSPRSDEYRGKGRRNNRDLNTNQGAGPSSNGNHATPKSEPNTPHTDQPKPNSANNNSTPSHIDEVALQTIVSDLQNRYPTVQQDKIRQVIKKHNYDPNQSLHELENLARGEKQPWTAIVQKGKAAKPETSPAPASTPAQAPTTAPAAHNENTSRREKKRGDQHQQQNQQQQQQQQNRRQPQQASQPQQTTQTAQPAQQPQQPPQQAHFAPQPQQFYQHPFHQDQLVQQQLLQQQIVQQHQPYQQPFGHPDAFTKGNEDILSGLSKAIERELAEVQKKTDLLSILKSELDTIHNADKDQRSQLEIQRAQLEKDRQAYAEHLRRVESELTVVEQRIKSAEEDKRRKVDDLYRNFKSHGILAITNS